jgi:hypothetical protein
MSASIVLSMSICRASRARLDPSDMRTAFSRRRPSARTNSRFATLLQAMSNTNPTVASTISSGRRASPTM